jgi:hypothetical protein
MSSEQEQARQKHKYHTYINTRHAPLVQETYQRHTAAALVLSEPISRQDFCQSMIHPLSERKESWNPIKY